jgi:hypothetical protein
VIFDTLCFSVCYLFLHVPMDKGRGGGCPFDAEGKRRGGGRGKKVGQQIPAGQGS